MKMRKFHYLRYKMIKIKIYLWSNIVKKFIWWNMIEIYNYNIMVTQLIWKQKSVMVNYHLMENTYFFGKHSMNNIIYIKFIEIYINSWNYWFFLWYNNIQSIFFYQYKIAINPKIDNKFESKLKINPNNGLVTVWLHYTHVSFDHV